MTVALAGHLILVDTAWLLLLVSMDLRLLGRHKLAAVVDIINAIQAVRLIALRGHYTIDVITSYLLLLL